jgi:adenylate cyclase
MDVAARWQRRLEAEGRPVVPVNAAVASGRIVFGAVGEKDRLEYTVIGDAVNLAAKLEKHNAAAGSRALATAEAYALAQRQGYRPTGTPQPLPQAEVDGVGHPLDLVRLA